MPAQNRLRLDQHPDQSRTAYPLAQRRHDRPIRSIQSRPLDLPARDAKLVQEKEQLRLRVVDPQPQINQIEEEPKPGVHETKSIGGRNPNGQATSLRVACPPMNK